MKRLGIIAMVLLGVPSCSASSAPLASQPSSLSTPSTTPIASRQPSPTVSLTPAATPAASVLDPSLFQWTPAELKLLAGIRQDVQAKGCHPVRDHDLPPDAIAGVGCDIRSELVDGVGFYQFDSIDALMAVYEARLAQYGIPLATDVPEISQPPRDCWRGYESESIYWPGGEGPDMNREGCFVNEFGFANLRYVWGGPLVYIGVLGNNGDIAALKAWSWYDEAGSEPSSGGPGIWQPRP